MKYINVLEASKKLNLSERTIRNYCASGKIPGAFLEGKTWKIPNTVTQPNRKKRNDKFKCNLLDRLRFEKAENFKGGIYQKIQVDLTYNSNHIEGSMLTHDQTRFIYETNTLGITKEPINTDDIIETVNHFRCVDLIIDEANKQISEKLIKKLHLILKSSTSDSSKDWFSVGEYKKYENEVGGKATTKPQDVAKKMKELICSYNKIQNKTIEDIIAFHYQFEIIHPFQDGNGRVGRLIMFKECLKHRIVPFIIYDNLKHYYYRGLKEWKNEKGYLIDTCLSAQDQFKSYLDYFKIKGNLNICRVFTKSPL